MLSLVVVTYFISLVYYSLFKELNIDITSNTIIKIAPTCNCIRNIIVDTAAKTLTIAYTKYNGKKMIYII